MVAAAVCAWRFIPESPVRSPGRVNWTAAALMSVGLSAVLIGIAQTSVWGWTRPRRWRSWRSAWPPAAHGYWSNCTAATR